MGVFVYPEFKTKKWVVNESIGYITEQKGAKVPKTAVLGV